MEQIFYALSVTQPTAS